MFLSLKFNIRFPTQIDSCTIIIFVEAGPPVSRTQEGGSLRVGVAYS